VHKQAHPAVARTLAVAGMAHLESIFGPMDLDAIRAGKLRKHSTRAP
jgi:hypothetical protein